MSGYNIGRMVPSNVKKAAERAKVALWAAEVRRDKRDLM